MKKVEGILLIDHHSTFNKGQLYGSKGDKVTIIDDTGEVLIVEGKKGRYSITKE
jgi:predicted proteasome-type protease